MDEIIASLDGLIADTLAITTRCLIAAGLAEDAPELLAYRETPCNTTFTLALRAAKNSQRRDRIRHGSVASSV